MKNLVNKHRLTKYIIKLRTTIFFSLFPFLFSLFSCAPAESSKTEFALGTVCSISVFDRIDNGVYNQVFSRIREIENLMSVNIPSSDVSRVNAAAGIEAVNVHEDVFFVIKRALYYAQISGGAFDPTIGPLVSIWGISSEQPRIPTREEIEEALSLVNWQDVELDANLRAVFLKRRGMVLDLGAIAKGYAADEAAAILKKVGVKRAIIDLGGDIVTLGERKDGGSWRVGIQNPAEGRGAYIGILQVKDKSAVTSGVYERFFEAEGKSWHHIFSPSTGYPAESGLLSVTITAPSSTDADALSTAVFVLGYERGVSLIESIPNTEAVFIFNDMTVKKTSGAEYFLR